MKVVDAPLVAWRSGHGEKADLAQAGRIATILHIQHHKPVLAIRHALIAEVNAMFGKVNPLLFFHHAHFFFWLQCGKRRKGRAPCFLGTRAVAQKISIHQRNQRWMLRYTSLLKLIRNPLSQYALSIATQSEPAHL